MAVRILYRPDGTKVVEAVGYADPNACKTSTQPYLKGCEVLEDRPKTEMQRLSEVTIQEQIQEVKQ